MIRLWDDRCLDEIRSQPLEPLAERLGYCRDPRDPRRWKRAGSVISVNGPRWFDHVAQSGGGGAIDLVMHARRCGFADAVALLAGSAGTPGPRIPPHREAAWPAVRRHLAEARGLPTRCVDACRRRGLVAADARRNAVFACTDAGRNVTGAEIVGTVTARDGKRYRSMARGSRKSAGSFWLPVDRSEPDTVMLTESAIDAFSAWCLDECRRPGTVIMSTAGVARRLPGWAEAWTPKRILVAFDADPVGDRAAERFLSEDRRACRLRPPHGHEDWNAVLKARAVAFPSK